LDNKRLHRRRHERSRLNHHHHRLRRDVARDGAMADEWGNLW